MKWLAGCRRAAGIAGGLSLVVVCGVRTFAEPPAVEVRSYRSEVEFLANPSMEGRGPGTRGNELAAERIEHAFSALGLRGAFEGAADGKGAAPGDDPGHTFRQEFTAGSRAVLKSASFEGQNPLQKDGKFVLGTDYSVLGFSGSGQVRAPLVFVGYSIEKGGPEGNYTSYPKDYTESPDGKVAIVFRFQADGRAWEELVEEAGGHAVVERGVATGEAPGRGGTWGGGDHPRLASGRG